MWQVSLSVQWTPLSFSLVCCHSVWVDSGICHSSPDCAVDWWSWDSSPRPRTQKNMLFGRKGASSSSGRCGSYEAGLQASYFSIYSLSTFPVNTSLPLLIGVGKGWECSFQVFLGSWDNILVPPILGQVLVPLIKVPFPKWNKWKTKIQLKTQMRQFFFFPLPPPP